MQKITPFLWFDGKAEEAMNFYISIFKNSKIVSVYAIWRSRARTEGDGNDCEIRAQWTRICRAKRRPAVYLHGSYIVCREL